MAGAVPWRDLAASSSIAYLLLPLCAGSEPRKSTGFPVFVIARPVWVAGRWESGELGQVFLAIGGISLCKPNMSLKVRDLRMLKGGQKQSIANASPTPSVS